MARTTAKTRMACTAAVLAFCFASTAGMAAEQAPANESGKNAELLLGDENSDAIQTSSISKVDSGSCEKTSNNLKVNVQKKKIYVPEETP